MKEEYSELCPIFIGTEKDVIQIGTGVLIELFGFVFLFTAAHIIDETENDKGTLMIPCEDSIESIDGFYSYISLRNGQERGDDILDIGYYKLSKGFSKKLHPNLIPLKDSELLILQDFSNIDVLSFAGYPSTKSKRKNENIFTEVFSYSGVKLDQAMYQKFGFDPKVNILSLFRAKKVVDLKGNHYTPPKPSGISGGGIYAWQKNEDGTYLPFNRKLIGIGHTYKKREKLFVGTNILFCINCVQRNNRELLKAMA